MISRRPPFFSLAALLITIAGVTAGHASSHDTPTADDHSSPPDAARNPPLTPAGESGPEQHQAPDESRPAGQGEAPAQARLSPGKKIEAEGSKLAEKPKAGDTDRLTIAGVQKLGTSLAQHNDWDGAEIAFREILTKPEANPDELANALLSLARVYRKQGALTKAAAVYERYLKDYPNADQVPDALLEVGRTHRALGAHQLALERFYNVLHSTLKLPTEGSEHYQTLAKTAQFEIAETHFQLGNFADANKYFSRLRLLDLAPADRARAHFKSAYALYLNHDLVGAVTALHSYLEQWPQDENVGEARYLLSISLRAVGRKQEALDTALVLLRTEQSNGDPKRWAYWQRRTGNQLANDFFQAGDTMNALAIYQGLMTLSPEPTWRLPATYQIALCYERMRQYDRATTAYQSIVEGAKPAPAEKPGTSEPGKPPNPELTELARMATWRLGQINWHEQTEHQLSSIFATGNDATAKTAPESHSVAPNIDSNASSQPTITPSNDHTGSAAKTPAGL